jgi:hypothetical protein
MWFFRSVIGITKEVQVKMILGINCTWKVRMTSLTNTEELGTPRESMIGNRIAKQMTDLSSSGKKKPWVTQKEMARPKLGNRNSPWGLILDVKKKEYEEANSRKSLP